MEIQKVLLAFQFISVDERKLSGDISGYISGTIFGVVVLNCLKNSFS